MLAALLMTALLQGAAQPQSIDAFLYTGEDLIEWRLILEDGLDPAERAQRYANFVRTYPQSPLAEVALARAVNNDMSPEQVLEPLDESLRRPLRRSHRAHQARLRQVPPTGTLVTDAQ